MFGWLGRCKLIMLHIACSEYEGFSFVYDFFGPIDAFIPGWKSSGLGHREILGESQSKDMKALPFFWDLLVSAPAGVSRFRMLWDPGCEFCYIPVQFVCEASAARCTPGALTCIFALVEFGLVLTVGVSVAVTVGIVAALGCSSRIFKSDSGCPLFSVEAVCHRV